MIKLQSFVAILLLMSFTTSSFAQGHFFANLEADNIPPGGTDSPATGVGTFSLNPAADALKFEIALNGLDLDGMQTPGEPADDVTNVILQSKYE